MHCVVTLGSTQRDQPCMYAGHSVKVTAPQSAIIFKAQKSHTNRYGADTTQLRGCRMDYVFHGKPSIVLQCSTDGL